MKWLPSSLQGVGSNRSDAPGEPGALGVKYFGQASGGKLALQGDGLGYFFTNGRLLFRREEFIEGGILEE